MFGFLLKLGLPFLAEKIKSKPVKEAIKYIQKETGASIIPKENGEVVISHDDMIKIKELETKLALEKLHLEHEEKMKDGEYNFALKGKENELEEVKLENEDRENARELIIETLHNDDIFISRFVPYLTIFVIVLSLGLVVFLLLNDDIIKQEQTIAVMVLTAAIGWIGQMINAWVGSNKHQESTLRKQVKVDKGVKDDF